MKVQNTGVASKSERVLQFVKRIVLSWPGKVMLAVAVLGSLMSIPLATLKAEDDHGGDESKIQQGFALAPVPLDLRGKNRALVGLGSYIVNTGGCNDCHTVPPYAPGNDKDGKILQVMPWPVFGLKTDRDLNAIYEYLTSIPSLSGPGSRDP